MRSLRVLTFLLTLVLAGLETNNGITASYNDVVYQAQNRLLKLGYRPGPSDGVFGERTRAALIRFQRDHNLPETGVLDNKTLHQLQSSNPPKTRQSQQPTMAIGDKTTSIQPESPAGSRPDREHTEVAPTGQAAPTRAAARHMIDSRPTPRDPRLDRSWGFVSPAGCYWECQRSSGCHDGEKNGVAVTANKGARRGVDAQRVYRHPGWVQVCD